MREKMCIKALLKSMSYLPKTLPLYVSIFALTAATPRPPAATATARRRPFKSRVSTIVDDKLQKLSAALNFYKFAFGAKEERREET